MPVMLTVIDRPVFLHCRDTAEPLSLFTPSSTRLPLEPEVLPQKLLKGLRRRAQRRLHAVGRMKLEWSWKGEGERVRARSVIALAESAQGGHCS